MVRAPVDRQDIATGIRKPARYRQCIMSIGETLRKPRPFGSGVLRGSSGCDGGACCFSGAAPDTVREIERAIATLSVWLAPQRRSNPD
jgi:hypothetical protein